MELSNIPNHFATITKHKLTVMDLCFKVGLVKQGLLHDLSKYYPSEFLMGIRYYQGGKRSPNAAERQDRGYSSAWLHHKGRNTHHLEYWMDNPPEPGGPMVPVKMPLNRVLEMVCDRIAASKVYNGAEYTDDMAWKYYNRRQEWSITHPETRILLEKLLVMLKDEGEFRTLAYMRWLMKHPRSSAYVQDPSRRKCSSSRRNDRTAPPASRR